jgi:hypothetical protein
LNRNKIGGFGTASQQDAREVVTHSSYLDVDRHWEAILQGIFRYNTSGLPRTFDPHDYCLVALDGTRPGHGVVLGNSAAPRRLVVVNWGDVHFDPCLLR